MLEKLKDIFYDKNDFIVALAILVVAGVIITHQVDAIMSYPEQLAREMQEQQQQQDHLDNSHFETSAKPGGDDDVTDPSGEGEGDTGNSNGEGVTPPETQTPDTPAPPETTTPETQTPSTSSEFKTAVERTVEIPSGSYSTKIAEILAEAGVVPSKDAFLDAVSAAGLETKLKAGTFTIPVGSTLNDVVTIVTK